MEHTKRLLRAFFELSQTHRGEFAIGLTWLQSLDVCLNYYCLSLGLVFGACQPVRRSSRLSLPHLAPADLQFSVSHRYENCVYCFWSCNLPFPAFGDVFSVIGVREPQAAASEAFVKFADAHRSIEKYGIQLLKTIKPVSSRCPPRSALFCVLSSPNWPARLFFPFRCCTTWTLTFTRPFQTRSSPSENTWTWSLNIWWVDGNFVPVLSWELGALLHFCNALTQYKFYFCLSVVLPQSEGNGWWGIQQHREWLFL